MKLRGKSSRRLNFQKLFLYGVLILSCLLPGCLVIINSITVPDSTTTGKVITFTVNAGMGGNDGSSSTMGIIFQVPEGTQILRAHYDLEGHRGDLTLNNTITSGYTAEPGYQLIGGVAD